MKIGVVGAGNVGTAIAKRLVPVGHEVMLSYSLDEAGLEGAASHFGARSGTAQEAAKWADVVALAVPWVAVPAAIEAAGSMEGKILWDCTNSLKPDMSGLAIGTTRSGAEVVAELAKGARVVKGIPPFAELMHGEDPTLNGIPAGTFVCSDDAEAKAVVSSLLKDLPATVVDAGPLENARYAEPAGFLLVRLAYSLGMGGRIGLRLLR